MDSAPYDSTADGYHAGSATTVLTAGNGDRIEVDTLSYEDLKMLAGLTRRSVLEVFASAVEAARVAALAQPRQPKPVADGGQPAAKRGRKPAEG